MDQRLTGKQQELLGLLRDGFTVVRTDALYVWLDPPKGDERDRQIRHVRTYRSLVAAGMTNPQDDE
jgi:hypothetical protein